MESHDRPDFDPGKVIENRFTVIQKLGRGGFGDVYLVEDTNKQRYALKTEYLIAKKQALEREIGFLKKIKNPFVPKVYFSGEDDICRYFVMDIYGPSLMVCKKSTMRGFLPPQFVILIAEETLYIMETIHKLGIVHRDIKASNFLLRPHNKYPLCLIDFGISNYFIDPKTKHLIPNEGGKFVGTAKYASINVHKRNQQTPRDDLMSWFYMLADLSLKRLPWSKTKDKNEILSIKESTSASDLCQNLPYPMIELYRNINSLEYGEKPNYNELHEILKRAMNEDSLEWEGTEWRQLWELSPDEILVNRTPGDEKFDVFDPKNPHKNYLSNDKKCFVC